MLWNLFIKLLAVVAIRHLTGVIWVETTSGSFCVDCRVCHLVEREWARLCWVHVQQEPDSCTERQSFLSRPQISWFKIRRQRCVFVGNKRNRLLLIFFCCCCWLFSFWSSDHGRVARLISVQIFCICWSLDKCRIQAKQCCHFLTTWT